MKQILVLYALLLICPVLNAQVNRPTPVIFDTDMGPDYDDAAAIALLHAFADSGKANILATVASTKYEGVAAVLSVFNTYFKRPHLPIGVPKGDGVTTKDRQHWTDSLIRNYPHRVNKNTEVPDAVDIYRQVLASQPDNSVTIITVGFFTNLANLLTSKPDKFSNLPGQQLVKQKVRKLVSMAGKFPFGREFNIYMDARAAQYVLANWTSPVIFSGFEIGEKIKTGLPLVQNKAITGDPVKDVFRISLPLDPQDKEGRMSWDETAVLVGINGNQPYYTLVEGAIQINQDGSNTWNAKGKNQFYLVEKQPSGVVQNLINKMMQHQPK